MTTHMTFASEQQRTEKDRELKRGQDSEVAVHRTHYQALAKVVVALRQEMSLLLMLYAVEWRRQIK